MDKNTPSFNLNVVVRETGIKPDTLRAWERRYGLPDPKRTEGGHRLYSTNDIELIRWLISRQKEGMRISHAVELWKGYQLEGNDPLNPPPSASPSPAKNLPDDSALTQLRQKWVEACLAFNEIGADQAMAEALARFPVQMACTEVLQKGLQIVGERWYQSTANVQQEHFASAVASKRLQVLIGAAPAPTRTERIIVGCPPGEEHTFSAQLINLFLRYRGYQVTYLGANVPLDNLEETVEHVRPDLVVYTAMHLNAAAALLDIANLLAEKNLRFSFGGRIFSIQPELQDVIPGYFLGGDLGEAPEVVGQILAGTKEENPAFKLSAEFAQAVQIFTDKRPLIASRIFDHYAGSAFPGDRLEETNHQFSQFLESALRLGNLDFLDEEISWVETMIRNQEIPADLVDPYLSTFSRILLEEVGEAAGVFLPWFEKHSR